MYVYFKENSAGFLVIYSCTVRGIVYLNIDKACSLSLSLSTYLCPFPSRCAKSCGAKFTAERGIIRPKVQCSQPQNVSRPFAPGWVLFYLSSWISVSKQQNGTSFYSPETDIFAFQDRILFIPKIHVYQPMRKRGGKNCEARDEINKLPSKVEARRKKKEKNFDSNRIGKENFRGKISSYDRNDVFFVRDSKRALLPPPSSLPSPSNRKTLYP